MISVDDYTLENYKIADIAKKYGMEKDFIFFLNINDNNGRHKGVEEMARKLSSEGFIIGSHTVNHKSLTEISVFEAKNEIEESKSLIKEWTGKCEWISYPYGQYNDEVIEMVKSAGYKYARTTHTLGLNSPYEIPAMHIGRTKGDEYGGQDSFEMALRTNIKHFYLHYYDLVKSESIEQFDNFIYEKSRN